MAVLVYTAQKAGISLSVIGVAVDFLQVVSLFSSFGFQWPVQMTVLFKAASASTVNEQLVRGGALCCHGALAPLFAVAVSW